VFQCAGGALTFVSVVRVCRKQSRLTWAQACLKDRGLGLLETRASFSVSRLGLPSKRCRYAISQGMPDLPRATGPGGHVPQPQVISLDKASILTSVPDLVDDIVDYSGFICSSLGLDIPR
jgi:hypothetical protein